MRHVKQLVRRVRRSALLTVPSVVLARAVFALPPARSRAAGAVPGAVRVRDLQVVLAPPGGGNIGDQAMVESFAENVAGPVRVVVTGPAAIAFDDLPGGRVLPVVLPDLVYGTRLVAHLRDVRRFRTLLRDAASFSVVGADTMDGAYNLRASLRRTLVADLAAGAGVDTRVLGFSWNDRPHPAVRRALRAASRRGVVLMLRDPVSAERARADGMQHVVGVADTVFSLTTTDDDGVADVLGDVPAGSPVALVNVSALVGRSLDQTGEYVRVVEHLRASGLAVVLVPHVSRPGADDLDACRRVLEALEPGTVTFVDRVLTPGQIKALCARSDLVLTGRMHLAVMALSAGVPAITLATQGKVEGLMEIFGVRDLCVTPRPGMADVVIALVGRILAADGVLVERVRSGLPRARELSAANFASLPAPAVSPATPAPDLEPLPA